MKASAASTKCACGSPLPVHFLEFADERFSHVCQCERKYKVVDGAFVQDGFEVNPFARYDAQAKAKKTKKTKAKRTETKTKKAKKVRRKEG